MDGAMKEPGSWQAVPGTPEAKQLAERLLRPSAPTRLEPAARARILARLSGGSTARPGGRPVRFTPAGFLPALAAAAATLSYAPSTEEPHPPALQAVVASPQPDPARAPSPVVHVSPVERHVVPSPPTARVRAVRAPRIEGAELLESALDALHSQAPALALEKVVLHDRLHPRGPLGPEINAVRVQALLALDRSGEALTALEHLDLESHPNRAELLLLKMELLARAGRCAEALKLVREPSPRARRVANYCQAQTESP